MNDTKWKENPVTYQVPGCCVDIEDKREELDWRNSIIKQRLKEMWKETIKKHIRKWKVAGGMAIG